MMRLNRSLILVILAGLTICFLGAAFALWFNPAGLPLVAARDPETPLATNTDSTAADQSRLQLTVNEPGIVAVTAEQLQSAGLSLSNLTSDQLSLTYEGQPVPFLTRPGNDEQGPALYFYAAGPVNAQDALPVYELRRGQGMAMAERSAEPFNTGQPEGKHHLVWEERRFFVEDGSPRDAWMGPLLPAPGRWTLHLDTIVPDGREATLRLRLFSDIEPQGDERHQVEILVNDKTVAKHLWQSAGEKSIKIPLQAGILNPDNTNSVTVLVLDDTAPVGEGIYIDSLELEFDGPVDVSSRAVAFQTDAPNIRINGAGDDLLVFDVSQPESPVLLSGARQNSDSADLAVGGRGADLVALNPGTAQKATLERVPLWPMALRDAQRGADYIAIVADVRGFDEALAPLLTHRQEQDLRVVAVSVEQIFDEFAYGRRDPQAIKDFIDHAAAEWQPPAPQFVLLVGDANYDLTNQIPGKNRNRLPTKLLVSEQGSHVASDLWYVMEDDGRIDVAIGRFPAQNAPQLSNMVAKTIAYEQELAAGDGAWTREALLVADDEPVYDHQVGELAHYLDDSGYEVFRLQMSRDDNIQHDIISSINRGVGLVSYMGHGSENAWGDEAVLQSSDAQVLYNGPRLPIFNTFTCRSGAFANPRTDSLAESLLRANSGGIIASVAPSGEIAADQQLPLTLLFHQQLLEQDERLGDRLLDMVREAGRSGLQDAIQSVNLLGDPALQLSVEASN